MYKEGVARIVLDFQCTGERREILPSDTVADEAYATCASALMEAFKPKSSDCDAVVALCQIKDAKYTLLHEAIHAIGPAGQKGHGTEMLFSRKDFVERAEVCLKDIEKYK